MDFPTHGTTGWSNFDPSTTTTTTITSGMTTTQQPMQFGGLPLLPVPQAGGLETQTTAAQPDSSMMQMYPGSGPATSFGDDGSGYTSMGGFAMGFGMGMGVGMDMPSMPPKSYESGDYYNPGSKGGDGLAMPTAGDGSGVKVEQQPFPGMGMSLGSMGQFPMMMPGDFMMAPPAIGDWTMGTGEGGGGLLGDFGLPDIPAKRQKMGDARDNNTFTTDQNYVLPPPPPNNMFDPNNTFMSMMGMGYPGQMMYNQFGAGDFSGTGVKQENEYWQPYQPAPPRAPAKKKTSGGAGKAKRKASARSMDRTLLTFDRYWQNDDPKNVRHTSKKMGKTTSATGRNAKGFQRGGVRTENPNAATVYAFGGKPPVQHAAYSRIRVWKDSRGRQFYDCLCDARKPVQDLNKIKRHAISHDQGGFMCDVCGKIFRKNHLQLNAHKKTHSKESKRRGGRKRSKTEMESTDIDASSGPAIAPPVSVDAAPAPAIPPPVFPGLPILPPPIDETVTTNSF